MEYFNSITDFLFIVTMVLLGQVHSKFFDTARGFSRDGLNVNVHICLVVTKFSCLGFHWLWIHWKEGCMYMLEGCLPFFSYFSLIWLRKEQIRGQVNPRRRFNTTIQDLKCKTRSSKLCSQLNCVLQAYFVNCWNSFSHSRGSKSDFSARGWPSIKRKNWYDVTWILKLGSN